MEKKVTTGKSFEEKILILISEINLPGFFVIAEFKRMDYYMPNSLENFMNQKASKIIEGYSGRKFVFIENQWRIILTFYPTDEVVDEKYALKNKFLKE